MSTFLLTAGFVVFCVGVVLGVLWAGTGGTIKRSDDSVIRLTMRWVYCSAICQMVGAVLVTVAIVLHDS